MEVKCSLASGGPVKRDVQLVSISGCAPAYGASLDKLLQ